MRKIVSMGKYAMEGEVLGKGNFARVELATHKLTKVKVAIKIIDTRKIKTRYQSRNLYREAKVLSQVRHPSIVRMYETLKASYFYCLVLEFVPNKDLSTYLKTLPNNKMEENEAWLVLRQLASAVLHLHQLGIVHRDLKMDNILLDETKQTIKIVDFGLSNCFQPGELLKTHCGSPEYAAPELFQDKHDYGPEVDAWSFGVIMYGVLVGSLPFIPGSTEPSKRHALLRMLNKGLIDCHVEQMNHLTIDCRSLILQLIEPKPELRMPMHEVVLHQWITRGGAHPLLPRAISCPDDDIRLKVISKVSQINKMDTEIVEEAVSENKFDALSAQYNMLLDRCLSLKVGHLSMNHIETLKSPTISSSGPQKNSRMYALPSTMSAVLTSAVVDDTPLACSERVRRATLTRDNSKDSSNSNPGQNCRKGPDSPYKLLHKDMRLNSAVKCLQFQTPTIKITHDNSCGRIDSKYVLNSAENSVAHHAVGDCNGDSSMQVNKDLLSFSLHQSNAHEISLSLVAPPSSVDSSHAEKVTTSALVHNMTSLSNTHEQYSEKSCSRTSLSQVLTSLDCQPSSEYSDVFFTDDRLTEVNRSNNERPTKLPLSECSPERIVTDWLHHRTPSADISSAVHAGSVISSSQTKELAVVGKGTPLTATHLSGQVNSHYHPIQEPTANVSNSTFMQYDDWPKTKKTQPKQLILPFHESVKNGKQAKKSLLTKKHFNNSLCLYHRRSLRVPSFPAISSNSHYKPLPRETFLHHVPFAHVHIQNQTSYRIQQHMSGIARSHLALTADRQIHRSIMQ